MNTEIPQQGGTVSLLKPLFHTLPSRISVFHTSPVKTLKLIGVIRKSLICIEYAMLECTSSNNGE